MKRRILAVMFLMASILLYFFEKFFGSSYEMRAKYYYLWNGSYSLKNIITAVLGVYLIYFLNWNIYQKIKNKKKARLITFYIVDVLIIITSFICAYIFNSLPGRGMAPGLTYMGHFLTSGFIFIVSIFLLIVVSIVRFFKKTIF